MAAPLTPHWPRPSHPDLLHVVHPCADPAAFASRAISAVSLPPGAVFAELTSPPLTAAKCAAYSTVQTAAAMHMELNSDLVYINHSCVPSLEFDVERMVMRVAAGKALRQGDELTYFYPSTEWAMVQPFHCRCGAGAGVCKGWIAGAAQMPAEALRGYWINAWIRGALREERALEEASSGGGGGGDSGGAGEGRATAGR